MGIKVSTSAPAEPTFPCLRIFEGTGTIVLFTNKNSGTIIRPGVGRYPDIGKHRTDLIYENTKPYNDQVTLSND